MLEKDFERGLRKDLQRMFPGCLYLKLDAGAIQGIPDRLVLWRNRWAALEVKRAARSSHRPNQDYYIEKLDEWSFAAFIHPGNKKEVLNALQQAFRS